MENHENQHNDPTLPDPGDQTPPEGFEPQPSEGDIRPGIYEDPGDLIADAEAEADDDPEVALATGNAADDNEVDDSVDQ